MSLKLSTLKFIQKTIFGYEVDVLTFSQAGEDIIIRNFFYDRLGDRDKGFFVDIGAFHPHRNSNTYYLYRAGWRGINVDARPGSMKSFKKLRPGDINLEIAIAQNEGVGTYYDFGDHSEFNTMSTEYIETLGTTKQIKGKYEIPTSPLKKILEANVPNHTRIDFLSLDVEGLEEKVLLSNDWDKFRPQLIACEIYGHSLADIAETPVSQLLVAMGYEIYARVILTTPNVNTIFFVESKRFAV